MSPRPIMTAQDPFAEYPTYESASKGKGKGHNTPVIPEPAFTGFILIASVLAALVLSRWSNRRST